MFRSNPFEPLIRQLINHSKEEVTAYGTACDPKELKSLLSYLEGKLKPLRETEEHFKNQIDLASAEEAAAKLTTIAKDGHLRCVTANATRDDFLNKKKVKLYQIDTRPETRMELVNFAKDYAVKRLENADLQRVYDCLKPIGDVRADNSGRFDKCKRFLRLG